VEKKHFETLNVCSLFLLILFLLTGKRVLLYCAVGLIGTSIFIRPLGRLLASIWLKFSYAVGTFNSKVLLSIVFYIFLTPLAVVRRLFGRSHIIQREPGDSYWKKVDKVFRKEDLDKTW